MKKTMVTVILFLIAVTTNGLEIKYLRGIPFTDVEKQSWVNEKTDRALWEDIHPNLIERSSSREDENRQNRKSFDLEKSLEIVTGQSDSSKKNFNNIRSILRRSKCPSWKLLLDLTSSNECNESTLKCNTQKYRRQVEKWSIPQPFYVEEPRWVEVELDYEENLPYNLNNEKDTFFVTRGKRLSISNNQNGQGYYKVNENNDDKFHERSYEFNNDNNNNNDNRIKKINSKRMEDKRKSLKPNIRQLKDLVKDLEKIEEPFVLTRGKKLYLKNHKLSVNTNYKKEETMENGSIEKIQKKNLPKIYSTLTTIKANPDTLLKNMNDSTTLSKEHLIRIRNRKNSCDNLDCFEDYKKIRTIDDTDLIDSDDDYFEQRDKHSDIYDILEEPFFISRGKKMLKNTKQNEKLINLPIDKKELFYPINDIKIIFQQLFDSELCDNTNFCKDLTKLIIENDTTIDNKYRRNVDLDELFKKHDLFYIVRGKKIYLNKFSKENQLETDIKSKYK